jgi:hypothetical protein
VSKRTTLTLEDDVVSRLAEESRRTGKPFKVLVNEALRRGLERPARERDRFTVEARELGLRPGIELNDVHGLLERIEGQEHR